MTAVPVLTPAELADIAAKHVPGYEGSLVCEECSGYDLEVEWPCDAARAAATALALNTAIEQVRKLHRPVDCLTCPAPEQPHQECWECETRWPCDTIRSLGGISTPGEPE